VTLYFFRARLSCIFRTLTPLSCGQAFISLCFHEQIVMLSIDLLYYVDCPHDIQACNVHAFEGLAEVIEKESTFGVRQRFLPGYCMLNLSHTGVLNMVLKKHAGIHVRLEDIRIL